MFSYTWDNIRRCRSSAVVHTPPGMVTCTKYPSHIGPSLTYISDTPACHSECSESSSRNSNQCNIHSSATHRLHESVGHHQHHHHHTFVWQQKVVRPQPKTSHITVNKKTKQSPSSAQSYSSRISIFLSKQVTHNTNTTIRPQWIKHLT